MLFFHFLTHCLLGLQCYIVCTHAIEDVLCTGTTGVVETQSYTKTRDVHNRGKQVPKLSEENVSNIVEATPVGPIKDEEVAVENLHSVEKSYSKVIEQVLADEGELGPKIPTPTNWMTRARTKEVAEDSPPLQSQKKKSEKAKQKVGAAAKKRRK